MRVLLINGSPRGKKSNTLKLAKSFVAGYTDRAGGDAAACDLETVHLSTMDIAPCKGCFACWRATPGSCCMHDDMAGVVDKLHEADLVVWSFPLYFYNVPGTLKSTIDRLLPLNPPFMSERSDGQGSAIHDYRYERKDIKHVLVSTCGFWSAEGGYDAVTAAFDHMLGMGNYETVFCGQGELFGVPEFSERIQEYLDVVKAAGSEYTAGTISESTRHDLARPLFPKDEFEAMANASWGPAKGEGQKDPSDRMLAEEMAARYKKHSYDGEDRVLELYFTDLGTSYQILLGEEGSEVFADGSLETTTRINTPSHLWAEVSRGELDPFKALGDHRYTVDGDFSLMTKWNVLFSPPVGRDSEAAVKEQLGDKLEPSMTTMLIPWITFWVVVPTDAKLGAVVAIAVALLMPVIMRKHKIVLWDWLSIAVVCMLSIVAAIVGDGDMICTLGYLIFGIMWIASCFTKEPLCAAYVKYRYGGDAALDNPIFMKPNIILAAAWGVLYVLTAIWTWLARLAGTGDFIVILNCIVPLAMDFFTEWFELSNHELPYEGASPMLLVDVEDREVLAGMVAAMLPQLPEPMCHGAWWSSRVRAVGM